MKKTCENCIRFLKNEFIEEYPICKKDKTKLLIFWDTDIEGGKDCGWEEKVLLDR